MTILEFPPVELADEHGLLAVGGDLEVSSLLLAYRSGIFPWPLHEDLLTWFAPPRRAVLFFEDLHISRSLKRTLSKNVFEFKINTRFEEVVRACAETNNRSGQSGTWITEDMIQAYISLRDAGYAHSVEAFKDGKLAGGHYGVLIGSMYAGESMFYRETDASKASLVYAIEILKDQGVKWLDCQVMTPLLEKFGAREISRDDFMELMLQATPGPKVSLEKP